jgi:hypothetical protein
MREQNSYSQIRASALYNGYLNGEISASDFKADLRNINFKNADDALKSKTGMSIEDLQKEYGFKLTRHEDLGMKKVYYVPTEIHANVGHTGGVANFKFEFDVSRNANNLVSIKNAFTKYSIKGAGFLTLDLAGN